MKWLPLVLLVGCAADTQGTFKELADGVSTGDSGEQTTTGIEIDGFEPRKRPSSNGSNDTDAGEDAATSSPLHDGGSNTNDAAIVQPEVDAGEPWPYAMQCEDCLFGQDSECGPGFLCVGSTCYKQPVPNGAPEGWDCGGFSLKPTHYYDDNGVRVNYCIPANNESDKCAAWNERYAALKD